MCCELQVLAVQSLGEITRALQTCAELERLKTPFEGIRHNRHDTDMYEEYHMYKHVQIPLYYDTGED